MFNHVPGGAVLDSCDRLLIFELLMQRVDWPLNSVWFSQSLIVSFPFTEPGMCIIVNQGEHTLHSQLEKHTENLAEFDKECD